MGWRVRNPLGEQPWVLAFSRPDIDLIVTLTALHGVVRVSLNWPVGRGPLLIWKRP